ncbi:nuclear transport factor 2 family protein [Nannocystis pusilla]|uniref:nuclear transport factor 2 family protein n=1 Tax=Nannocystis pusilla TaxID=889268 RepID=UPI003DA2D4AF
MIADLSAELRDAYDLWFASIPAKDASFVDRRMDPALELVNPDGTRLDAAGYKAMYDALPAGATVEYRIQEFNVRPLAGDAVALVTGRYHGRIGRDGAVLSDKQVRFTSVWERRDAGWILLLHHLTSCAA